MSHTDAIATPVPPAAAPVAVMPTTGSVIAATVSKRARRIGLAVSGIPTLLLAMDASLKVLRLTPAIEGTVQLGYPASVVLPLGLIQLVCLVLYVAPRTSVLGAILWTGYLGGAVATHLRIGNPLLTNLLPPVVVGALLWLGLWLREPRVRAALSPTRR